MSNPSLPSAPVPPPPMGAVTGSAASSSSPLRRAAARDPDDDDDALEEGELRVDPVPVGHESSDTEDDDVDGRMSYLIQPRAVEYNPYVFRRPQHRRRYRLDALDILLLGPGPGDALPSPTPSDDDECESDSTLSDHGIVGFCVGGDDPTGSSSTSSAAAATAAADVMGPGWAITGKRGWMAGGNQNKKPAAAEAEVVQEQEVFDLNTVSAATGEGPTTSIAQAAHQHQPPPAQPHYAPQPRPQAPRRKRERATEYTCKECGKSYPNNQALGGHAAGHRNKRREAEAMEAAMAAAVAAGVQGDAAAAAFLLPLRRGGKAAGEPHECRKCGKVFASGVALGGHMRVHYTGKPIVPDRKNKKRCLAPLPPPNAEGDVDAAVGLSLALSIKAEEHIDVAAAPPVVAAGLSLALSIKTEQELPPPAVPAGAAVRAVLLFGRNISAPPPLQQQQAPLQQGSGGTTAPEDSSSTGQQQH